MFIIGMMYSCIMSNMIVEALIPLGRFILFNENLGRWEWYKDDNFSTLHRVDGPAVVYEISGTQEWWADGVQHREDGPAVETGNGAKQWWVNGKRHCLDGPAMVWPDGSQKWFLFGEYVTRQKHFEFRRYLEAHPGSELLPFDVVNSLFVGLVAR